MINKQKIIDRFSQISLEPDEKGIIPAYGVYLTQMFGNYYSEISYAFEKKFEEIAPEGVQNAARQLLIESGHICGFNTFGGIMESDEWEAIVTSMLETNEDWIKAFVIFMNFLGWGTFELVEVSESKLVLNLNNSFEANYYIEKYGNEATSGKCYLEIGAAVSLMNLVYEGNIQDKPTLDEAYYDKLFKDQKKYRGKEVLCEAKGDDYCKIEISRVS